MELPSWALIIGNGWQVLSVSGALGFFAEQSASGFTGSKLDSSTKGIYVTWNVRHIPMSVEYTGILLVTSQRVELIFNRSRRNLGRDR